MNWLKKTKRYFIWRNVGLAWLLALGIIVGIFWINQISPFGNQNLLMSDMGTQYIPLLTALRHALVYRVFHMYTFSQSLGVSVVPTLAYYLMSPFNIIVVGFSAANVPMAASLIIMLKVATIAATMTWFLQRHFQTTQKMTVIFALGFSFCGFVAMNYFDLMWLDALIILPLMTDGLDQLMTHRRLAPFFWWLLAGIITNYYLGYMLGLFSLCYFSCRWLVSSTATWRQWGAFAGTVGLSGMSAAIILVPTGLGMLQTAKGTAKLLNFRVVPTFGLEFFSQFGIGASDYRQRLMHAPTVFVSSAVALLVLVYVVHPNIERRQKYAVIGLLGVLFLSMWIRVLNTVWHFMQAPAGFPFRNVFFFSFVCVMVAFAAWQAGPQQIPRHWQWGLPLIQAGLLAAGSASIGLMLRLVRGHSHELTQYYQAIQTIHWGSVIGAWGFILATGVVIFGTRRQLQQGLLALLVVAEVSGNFILAMRHTKWGNQVAYQQAYRVENQQMGQINDPDGQLYRVQNENTLINQAYQSTYNNYNDSLLFNFHGVTGYSSTLNETTRVTLAQLGLYSDNVRRISAVGLTPVTTMLLGVKKTVRLTRTGSLTKPTEGYIGMGFAVPAALQQAQLSSDALQNQEQILQALLPRQTPYLTTAKLLNSQVTHVPTAKTYKYHHRVKLRVMTNGWTYLWAPSGKTKYTTMRVGTRYVTPTMAMNGQTGLIKLGKFQAGQTVTLHFAAAYPIAAYHIRVATLQQRAFLQAKRVLSRQRLSLRTTGHHWQTQLVGQVNGTTQRRQLYLSLPFDTGWRVTVNGQSVAGKRVLNGLMAIPLQTGKNRVVLTYHVPGGQLGAMLSIIGIGTFILGNWWRQRRPRRP